MALRKLSDADKQEILTLYREPEHTTSTLAERYGVSNSTISRLLKAQLPEDEYSALIQQKRSSAEKAAASEPAPKAASTPRKKKSKAKPKQAAKSKPSKATPSPTPQAAKEQDPPVEEPKKSQPPVQETEKSEPPVQETEESEQLEVTAAEETPKPKPSFEKPKLKSKQSETTDQSPQPEEESSSEESADKSRRRRRRRSTDEAEQLTLTADSEADESAPEEVAAEAEEAVDFDSGIDDEDFDSDDDGSDDDYDDDDEFEGEDETDDDWYPPSAKASFEAVQISPLTAAAIPRMCYVVVDRSSADLVTCPLKEFSDLGQIPEEEQNARTLPIFDNHRVARRFSRRNQRVIKVPDGGLLQTTSAYLQAKGITRLLIDGRVYTIEPEDEPVTV